MARLTRQRNDNRAEMEAADYSGVGRILSMILAIVGSFIIIWLLISINIVIVRYGEAWHAWVFAIALVVLLYILWRLGI